MLYFKMFQVLEEFEARMEVAKETIMGNWDRAVPNIIDYVIDMKIPCISHGTLGEYFYQHSCIMNADVLSFLFPVFSSFFF